MKQQSRSLPSSRITTLAGGLPTLTRPTGFFLSVVAPLKNNGDFETPTNFAFTVQENNYFHGVHKNRNVNTNIMTYLVTGNLQRAVIIPPWENRTTAYNICLNKLNDSVRGGLDLSVALAEAGTTVRMIKGIRKLVQHAARLKPKGGYGATGDVANGYLQWNYGWKPLMSDIHGAALESLRVVTSQLETFRRTHRIDERRSDVKITYPIIDGVSNVPVDRKLGEGSFTACTIGLTLKVPDSAFQLDRWMSMSPASVAYELVPYSFVVDWFLDIGSYLRNFETACLYNTTFQHGYVSEIFRVDITDTKQIYEAPVSFSQRHILEELRGELRYVTFTRNRLASYPFPRRPTVNVDLGSGQLFSAAALLRQFLPKSLQSDPPSQSRGGGTIRR